MDTGKGTRNVDEATGTYKCDGELMKRLTTLHEAERRTLARWVFSQGEAVQVEAIRLQGDLVHQFNAINRQLSKVDRVPVEKMAEVRLACLVLAAGRMRCAEESMKRKGAAVNPGEILTHRVARVKAMKTGRSAPQAERFRVSYFHLVEVLREERGLSWREIEAYLKKHHRTKWGHSWIRRTYLRLKAALRGPGDTK